MQCANNGRPANPHTHNNRIHLPTTTITITTTTTASQSAGHNQQSMDGRRVGVLGGGQLGRMMAEAGHRLGIQLAVLDPGACGRSCDR